jgi:hypothetical protein
VTLCEAVKARFISPRQVGGPAASSNFSLHGPLWLPLLAGYSAMAGPRPIGAGAMFTISENSFSNPAL